MKIFVLLLLALSLSFQALADVTLVSNTQTTAIANVNFNEPTTEQLGTVGLTDLSYHRVNWRLDAGGWNESNNIPASGPSGGMQVIHQITVNNLSCGDNTIEAYSKSYDTVGNASPASQTQSLIVNVDCISPDAPDLYPTP